MGRVVNDVVREAAARDGSALALVHAGRRWSWREFDGHVDSVAATLDVAEGGYVAAQTSQPLELLTLFYAVARRAAVFVPLNARLTGREVAQLRELVPAGPAPTGARCALFTSGTTGVPKLVHLTEENFRASAAANAANLGASSAQRWLGTLPLFHVGGLAMAHRCAVAGASLQLEERFDAEHVAEALLSGAVTHASLVPTTLARVLEAARGRSFQHVEAVLIGGGPMTSPLLAKARAAGLPVLQTYGLTEACSQVTTERPAEADGTTAGPALAGLEVRIVEGGAVLSAGQVGNIEVRGPTVALGLGPWLATKDLGVLDERGRLRILSRRVDLIVTGGENVYPLEVEAVLREHPAVDDVAVIPVEDPTWGQVPVACVVSAKGVTAEELTPFARERLAAFKVPKRLILLQTLPRNAMGKLDREALRRLVGEW